MVIDDRTDDPAGEDAPVQLADLGRITAILAGAGDAASVAHVVTRRAARAVGADVASLSVLEDGDTLRLLALSGAAARTSARFATYPADACSPVGEAVSTRRMVVVAGRDELQRRYPALPLHAGERSIIAVPLLVGDRCLGGISLSFSRRKAVSADDRAFVRTLADTTAQALARLEAAAAAEARARKLAFLAEATVLLSSSLDYETTLTRVGRLALDELADWVGVELLDDDQLQPVVTLHRDPGKIALAEELRRAYPTPADALTGMPAVVRTGRSEFYPDISEQMLVDSATDARHLELIRSLGLESLMIVPLTVRGRVLGAMIMVSSDPRRHYTHEDLSFAEDLARRAAIAIDNAELFTQTRDVSQRLQRAVLPHRIPSPPEWRLAVHYRPAGRTDVGGDFFDLVELPERRLAAVVGDVMGRGVMAAAAMAQLRLAARAYLADDPDPTAVLTKLSAMYELYRLGGLATVVIALADIAAGQVCFASAGHPAPIVVTGPRAASTLELPSSPPLGAGRYPRESMSTAVPPGGGFLLYTDGLVEQRHCDIDERIDSLAQVVAAAPFPATETDLFRIASTVAPTAQDDLTIVSVQRA